MKVRIVNVETGENTVRDLTPEEIASGTITNIGAVKQSIIAELSRSDMVALRCFKAGVKFPDDWKAWDKQLRDSLSSPDLHDPNKKPPFPANT